VKSYYDPNSIKSESKALDELEKDGMLLRNVTDSLKKNKNIVLLAVKSRGAALVYADDSLKNDKDVVIAAVNENGWALSCADDELKSDQDIVNIATQTNPNAIRYADKSLKTQADLIEFHDNELNLTGKMSPLPEMFTRKVLNSMELRQILKITGTAWCVNRDLRALAWTTGNLCLEDIVENGVYTVHIQLIRKW